MAETLKLCVSCKACRRECPTGVDMARMKIEVQAARGAKRGYSLHDRLVGWLPRYAPDAAKRPWLANLRDRSPMLRKLSGRFAGFSRQAQPAAMARRHLPRPLRLVVPRGEGGCDARCGAVRRHLQPLFRAGKSRSGGERAGRRRLSRACGQGGRQRRAAAVLRSHLPRHRPDRRGKARDGAHDCGAVALCRARYSGDRPGAELPARLPRRDAGTDQERRCQGAGG